MTDRVLGRARWSPPARYWRSLWLLTERDLRVRYSTSVLGYLWSVLDPLLMAAIYWFVFTQVFDRTVGHEPYIVFLLSALLPWMWFNGAVGDMTRAYLYEAELIRSTKIPRTIWTARLVLAKGIEFVASIPVILVFGFLAGAVLHWQIVFWLLAIVLQFALILGIGLIVAPAVVFYRDLDRATKLALRFLFYASPVIYGLPDLPAGLQFWASFNPLAGIIGLYRSAYFPGELDWSAVGIGTGVTAAILAVGILVYLRTQRAVLKEI